LPALVLPLYFLKYYKKKAIFKDGFLV
jgi:hypothetical protein